MAYQKRFDQKRFEFTYKRLVKLPTPQVSMELWYDIQVLGLCLRITNNNARSFCLRYFSPSTKRECYHTIGRFSTTSYPDWTVEAAREKAVELQDQIKYGVDPSIEAPDVCSTCGGPNQVMRLNLKLCEFCAVDLEAFRRQALRRNYYTDDQMAALWLANVLAGNRKTLSELRRINLGPKKWARSPKPITISIKKLTDIHSDILEAACRRGDPQAREALNFYIQFKADPTNHAKEQLTLTAANVWFSTKQALIKRIYDYEEMVFIQMVEAVEKLNKRAVHEQAYCHGEQEVVASGT